MEDFDEKFNIACRSFTALAESTRFQSCFQNTIYGFGHFRPHETDSTLKCVQCCNYLAYEVNLTMQRTLHDRKYLVFYPCTNARFYQIWQRTIFDFRWQSFREFSHPHRETAQRDTFSTVIPIIRGHFHIHLNLATTRGTSLCFVGIRVLKGHRLARSKYVQQCHL